jgi:hypothetical protein
LLKELAILDAREKFLDGVFDSTRLDKTRLCHSWEMLSSIGSTHFATKQDKEEISRTTFVNIPFVYIRYRNVQSVYVW